jgi:hypothetical protein
MLPKILLKMVDLILSIQKDLDIFIKFQEYGNLWIIKLKLVQDTYIIRIGQQIYKLLN